MQTRFRRDTPNAILVTVALLALYGAYGFWELIVYRSAMSAVIGTLALVACVATAKLLAWSRYLVYLLTAVFIGTWLHSIYAAAAVGYFRPYSAAQITAQLAPGVLLAGLSSFCAYAVFRQFRAPRRV